MYFDLSILSWQWIDRSDNLQTDQSVNPFTVSHPENKIYAIYMGDVILSSNSESVQDPLMTFPPENAVQFKNEATDCLIDRTASDTRIVASAYNLSQVSYLNRHSFKKKIDTIITIIAKYQKFNETVSYKCLIGSIDKNIAIYVLRIGQKIMCVVTDKSYSSQGAKNMMKKIFDDVQTNDRTIQMIINEYIDLSMDHGILIKYEDADDHSYDDVITLDLGTFIQNETIEHIKNTKDSPVLKIKSKSKSDMRVQSKQMSRHVSECSLM
jgi:hypothetical protein